MGCWKSTDYSQTRFYGTPYNVFIVIPIHILKQLNFTLNNTVFM